MSSLREKLLFDKVLQKFMGKTKRLKLSCGKISLFLKYIKSAIIFKSKTTLLFNIV